MKTIYVIKIKGILETNIGFSGYHSLWHDKERAEIYANKLSSTYDDLNYTVEVAKPIKTGKSNGGSTMVWLDNDMAGSMFISDEERVK